MKGKGMLKRLRKKVGWQAGLAALGLLIVTGAAYAAGITAAFEAESGSATGTQTIANAGASAGHYLKFGNGVVTPPPPPPPPPPSSSTCPLPAYPNPNCTGVPSGTSLTTINGDYTAGAGEVIEGKRITGKLEISGSGVVVRKSEIYGEIKNYSTQSFTVEDSTIGPPSGCPGEAAIGNNNYTLRRVELRNFGEGPRVEHGGNVFIYDSFFKLCDPGGDAHSDGMQGYIAGGNVKVNHNTFDQRSVAEARVTAPIFWSDDSAGGMEYTNNLVAGGGYTIRIHSGSGHTVTGNKIVNNSWYFGPVSSNCDGINWNSNQLVQIDSNYEVTSVVSALNCAK